ncbi:efflux RND transporter periplasmic adaptor subunit [Rubripirellula amarantea]|nr:efflux RND transporter periplasmic adaptor subunit [Rubripirellula amarantea]
MNHVNQPTAPLASDPITVEVMSLCPQVRNDLRITRHMHHDVPSFLIEDPTSGRFSRVGVAEYTFVSLLDGRTTVAEALATTAAKHGLDALDEQDAVSLCGWIVEAGLAHTRASRSWMRVSDGARSLRDQQLAGAINPMFQKLPLGNPGFIVSPVVRFAKRYLANRYVVAVFMLWMSATWVAVVGNYKTFWASTGNVFASNNWIWLVVTWLIVKGVHEFGHAVACRWLGGSVGQAGVMFVLMMPLPYVEVSSSWGFRNKWHRIGVAAAGMMVEAFLASIAIWVWIYSGDPVVQMHARNLIVTATITTLVFNLNPLMRFDGYYMLSDYLELPNLSTNANRWLSFMRQKYWLGATVARPTWPEGRVMIVAFYGLAAFAWRILICVSLAIAASQMFWGAGVLLAALAIAFWIGKPLLRLITHWNDPMRINRRHFGWVTGALAIIVFSVLMIPYQRRVIAPMVVAHEAPTEIRSSVRGFVREILVEPGQSVREGQVLARLENQELEFDLQRLTTEISQSRQRQRVLRRDQMLVELEIERANENALTSRKNDLTVRLAGLVVQSDVDGAVIHSDLVEQIGTLVTEGKRLFVIADPTRMKLVAMIRQDDAVTLRHHDRFSADVWVEGQGRIIDGITFERLSPRATRDLTHPALASSLGGPLAVYSNPQAQDVHQRYKLVDPRVSAEAMLNLSMTTSGALKSGQRGNVRFALDRRRLGATLLDQMYQWHRVSGRNATKTFR